MGSSTRSPELLWRNLRPGYTRTLTIKSSKARFRGPKTKGYFANSTLSAPIPRT